MLYSYPCLIFDAWSMCWFDYKIYLFLKIKIQVINKQNIHEYDSYGNYLLTENIETIELKNNTYHFVSLYCSKITWKFNLMTSNNQYVKYIYKKKRKQNITVTIFIMMINRPKTPIQYDKNNLLTTLFRVIVLKSFEQWRLWLWMNKNVR